MKFKRQVYRAILEIRGLEFGVPKVDFWGSWVASNFIILIISSPVILEETDWTLPIRTDDMLSRLYSDAQVV